jgi:hypothetical protein
MAQLAPAFSCHGQTNQNDNIVTRELQPYPGTKKNTHKTYQVTTKHPKQYSLVHTVSDTSYNQFHHIVIKREINQIAASTKTFSVKQRI